MLGYSKDEIKKFTYQQLTPQKWHDIEEDIAQNQILARGYSDTYEKEYIRKDGIIFPISMRVWLLENEMGNPRGMWGFVRDITAQKQAEEKLRESEERFRIITEQSFLGIAIIQDDVIKYGNQKFAEIFDYTIEEMMNWAPSQYSILIHPKDKELVMNQSRKKQAGDKDVLIRYHFKGIKKSNEQIILDVFTKTIFLNGKPAELIMLNDITEQKAAEQRIETIIKEIGKQNQKLVELDKAKDEMLEIISHELRTPLVSILGFVELLSTNDSNLKEEQKDHLRILKRNTQRLNQLVETILNINKMELGKVHLDIKSFDFQQLINSVLQELYYRIKQKMHKICLDIPPNFKIRADEELIHQVISNLITNAIKYTPDRGTISIKGKKHGIKLLFSIKDTGIGMDREDLPKLFQKFERISYQEEKRLGDVKGIGLGLYLSKKIIELHGGKMWAESEGINQGSTFHFELPDQS